jgi:hypothetical protein
VGMPSATSAWILTITIGGSNWTVGVPIQSASSVPNSTLSGRSQTGNPPLALPLAAQRNQLCLIWRSQASHRCALASLCQHFFLCSRHGFHHAGTSYHVVAMLTSCTLLLTTLSQQALLQRREEHLLTLALSRGGDYVPCTTPDCSNGVVWTDEDAGSASAGSALPYGRFDCTECGHSYCCRCKTSFHVGKTCDEWRVAAAAAAAAAERGSGDDSSLDALVRTGAIQPCPGCGCPTFRAKGCDNIRCQQCGTHWIWRDSPTITAGADDNGGDATAVEGEGAARPLRPALYGAAGARTRAEWRRVAGVGAIGLLVLCGGRALGGVYFWYAVEVATMMGIEASLRGNPNRLLSTHGMVILVLPCMFEVLALPALHVAAHGVPGSAMMLSVLPEFVGTVFGAPLGTASWLAWSLAAVGWVFQCSGVVFTGMFVASHFSWVVDWTKKRNPTTAQGR